MTRGATFVLLLAAASLLAPSPSAAQTGCVILLPDSAAGSVMSRADTAIARRPAGTRVQRCDGKKGAPLPRLFMSPPATPSSRTVFNDSALHAKLCVPNKPDEDWRRICTPRDQSVFSDIRPKNP